MWHRVLMARKYLKLIQGFHCGNEFWEREIEEHLKAPEDDPRGILFQSKLQKRPVWLYLEDPDLVGYASLGVLPIQWPHASMPDRVAQVLPIGVDSRFHRKPAGPRLNRYSWRIMKNLVQETRALIQSAGSPPPPPLLTLFVHPGNVKAIKFYHDFGFIDQPIRQLREPVPYLGMALKL